MYLNPVPGLVPHLVGTWWHLAAPGGAGMCCCQEGACDREQAPVSTPIQIPHLQIISKSSPNHLQIISNSSPGWVRLMERGARILEVEGGI
jgi:hypothetical protein